MPPSAAGRPRLVASNALVASLLFAVTFSVLSFSIRERRQLGDLGRMADEWYTLGMNLVSKGVLGLEDEPILFRPPGYPVFVAAALTLFAGRPPGALTWGYWERGVHAVYLAQALALAAAVAVLFLWLARVTRRRVAVVSALAFGLNPYSVALAGLLHYDVLHLFFLVSGGWALGTALRKGDGARGRSWLGAGAVWGLATLVRPVTLLLPGFVLLAAAARPGTTNRSRLRGAALFTAGLAVAVAPWTARNYAVSGRLIPVNEQGWAVTWASTAKPLGVHPNHYKWQMLLPELTEVFVRVSGRPDFDYVDYVRSTGRYERVYREDALRNLRRSPAVYLGNAASAVASLSLHINSVFVKVFQHLQEPGASLQTSWFHVGHPQDFHPGGASAAFAVYAYLMTALAAGGLFVVLRERRPDGLGFAAVFACIALGHALTYMDLMYYYQRLPFLFVFSAFLVEWAQGRSVVLPLVGRRLALGPVALAAVASGLCLTPIVLA